MHANIPNILEEAGGSVQGQNQSSLFQTSQSYLVKPWVQINKIVDTICCVLNALMYDVLRVSDKRLIVAIISSTACLQDPLF